MTPPPPVVCGAWCALVYYPQVPVVALGKMMRFSGKAPPAGPHLEDVPAPGVGCGHRLAKLGEPVTVGEAGRLRVAARVLLFAAL
jgi:hypothetical protein